MADPTITLIDLMSPSIVDKYFPSREVTPWKVTHRFIRRYCSSFHRMILHVIHHGLNRVLIPKSDRIEQLLNDYCSVFVVRAAQEEEEVDEPSPKKKKISDDDEDISLEGELMGLNDRLLVFEGFGCGEAAVEYMNLEESDSLLCENCAVLQEFVERYFRLSERIESTPNAMRVLSHVLLKMTLELFPELLFAVAPKVGNEFVPNVDNGIFEDYFQHEDYYLKTQDFYHVNCEDVNRCDGGLFSKLTKDYHSMILHLVGNYKDLLTMRLVCQHWNTLIITQDTIWKNCVYFTQLEHLAFPYFTSIVVKDAISKKENQTWLEYFFKNIKTPITLQQDYPSLTYGLKFTPADEEQQHVLRTRAGGFPIIPSNFLSQGLWKDGYHFIFQLDCSELPMNLPGVCVLPSSGMLYFFAKYNFTISVGKGTTNVEADGYVVYHKHETSMKEFNPEEDDEEEAYFPYYNDHMQALAATGNHVTHASSIEEGQQRISKNSDCETLMLCSYEDTIKVFQDTVKGTISDNEIILLQTKHMLKDPGNDFSLSSVMTYFMIDVKDLIEHNFDRTRFAFNVVHPKHFEYY